MTGEEFVARVATSGSVLGLSIGKTADEFDARLGLEFLEERVGGKRRDSLLRRDYGLIEATFAVSDQGPWCTSIILEWHRLLVDDKLAAEYAPIIGGEIHQPLQWDAILKCLAEIGTRDCTFRADQAFIFAAFPQSHVIAHIENDHEDPVRMGEHQGTLWSLEILTAENWHTASKPYDWQPQLSRI